MTATAKPLVRSSSNTKWCEACSKNKVDFDTQGRDSTMCEPCFEFAGWENTHVDEGHEDLPEEHELRFECPVCLGNDPAKQVQPEEPEVVPVPSRTKDRTKLAGGTGTCMCSPECGKSTKGVFAQGHDARMVSKLVAEVIAGRLTVDEAAARVRNVGASDKLEAKLRAAVERKTTKAKPAS